MDQLEDDEVSALTVPLTSGGNRVGVLVVKRPQGVVVVYVVHLVGKLSNVVVVYVVVYVVVVYVVHLVCRGLVALPVIKVPPNVVVVDVDNELVALLVSDIHVEVVEVVVV